MIFLNGKINKHIEIVRTNRIELSSMSQESCGTLFALLSKHYAKVAVTTVNDIRDLEVLVAKKPDLVFLGMKFIPVNPALGMWDPNKIWLSQYFDENNIVYTGSSQNAHMLELNKHLAKQRVLDHGLKTSPFFVAEQDQPLLVSPRLKFPLFVKPANRGGGLGIDGDSVVHNIDDLRQKVQTIASKHRSDSLVEEYLPGREFSVAILKDELTHAFSVMPIELVAQPNSKGVRVLSEKIKSSNSEEAIKITDKDIRDEVSQFALEIFHALGARDYGRIDIRLDKSGTPHFLEANLIPSLIRGYGSYPKACLLNLGIDYEQMILSIVSLALVRGSVADKVAITEQSPLADAALAFS